MQIHLATLIGSYVGQLPHMLQHYCDLGINSFFINVRLSDDKDPIQWEVAEVAKRFGCKVEATGIGEWPGIKREMIRNCMRRYPTDWFILTDQDEFQIYPNDIQDIIWECHERKYDYIRGCFVDRIGEDGKFPTLKKDVSIWEQYPLGGFITYPILRGNPRKIVAAKGDVLLDGGHHNAQNGISCPTDRIYIQVHHFKWVGGIVERLKKRIISYKNENVEWWTESQQFIDYYEKNGGKIDIADSRFMIEKCDKNFRSWNIVREIAENTGLDVAD